MKTQLFIWELLEDEDWPERQPDFHSVGDENAVRQECLKHYAETGCKEYYITKSRNLPGVWLAWEEKGGAKA